MASKVTRWTMPQIEDFRAWHESRIKELYPADAGLIKELRRARERFLARLMPIPSSVQPMPEMGH